MPTKSYGVVNLKHIVTSGELLENGTITGIGFNKVAAGEFNLAFGGGNAISTLQIIKGELDYTQFPAIPSSASITKVEVSIDVTGITTGPDANVGTYQLSVILIADPLGAFTVLGSRSASNVNPVALAAAPIEYENIIPMDRNALIDQFGTLQLQIYNFIGNDGVPLAGMPVSLNLTMENFALTVTYDLENYSWYIKPTEVLAHGIPVKIIASSDDVITVPDGEDPPEGFVLYGTDDEFPDGPIYTWWTSVDFYLFFIFSPIPPTVDGPFAPWTEVVGVPTCSGCLTLALGTLDVLVADASGVYTLSASALNDTLYSRETSDTVEVKIPNPFVKVVLP